MSRSICIAVGTLENYRRCIGMSAYRLAIALQQNGWKVIVYAADCFAGFSKAAERLALLGIDMAFPKEEICETAQIHLERDMSLMLHNWLQSVDADFDIIYFADDLALGYIPIQAKRTMGSYKKTALCVTQFRGKGVSDGQDSSDYVKLIYMHRYCKQFCDFEIKQYFDRNSDLSMFDNIKPMQQTYTSNVTLSVCTYIDNDNMEYAAQLIDALYISKSNLEIRLAVGKENGKEPGWIHKFRENYKNIHIIPGDFNNIGEALNFAAEQAVSTHLMFIDPRMEIVPDFIKTFSTGLSVSSCDILTAWIRIKPKNGSLGQLNNIISYWGSCVEAGFSENTFGGLLFAIKRDVFEARKFETSVKNGETWAFLAKAALDDIPMDVIPKPLAFLEESYINRLQGKHAVICEYSKRLPFYCEAVLEAFGRSAPVPQTQYKQIEVLPKGYSMIPEEIYIDGVYIAIIRKLNKLLPKGGKAREFFKKLVRIFIKS